MSPPHYELNFGWFFFVLIFIVMYYYFFKIDSFIFCLWGSSLLLTGFFLVAHGSSSLLQFEGFSLPDFSYCPAWALGPRASAVATCGLSCSKACGIFLDQLRMELISPALLGGFLTTGPPGKPLILLFFLLMGLGCRLQVPVLLISLLG